MCELCGKPVPVEGRKRRFCSKPCADKAWKLKNPERAAEATRRWVAQNRTRSRAIKKKHADTNRELINAFHRATTDYSEEYQRKIARYGREAILAGIRARQLGSRNGITPEQYDALVQAQNGVCAICDRPETGQRLAVDHDHSCCPGRKACGQCLRGLLCRRCNQRLGIIEDTSWMQAATSYLGTGGGDGRKAE